MTSQAQSQSDKTTFNMDWSFGGVHLEKVLLERIMEQIRGAKNADNGFKKATLSSLITLAYRKLAWRRFHTSSGVPGGSFEPSCSFKWYFTFLEGVRSVDIAKNIFYPLICDVASHDLVISWHGLAPCCVYIYIQGRLLTFDLNAPNRLFIDYDSQPTLFGFCEYYSILQNPLVICRPLSARVDIAKFQVECTRRQYIGGEEWLAITIWCLNSCGDTTGMWVPSSTPTQFSKYGAYFGSWFVGHPARKRRILRGEFNLVFRQEK